MTRWIRSEGLIRSRMMQAIAIRLQGRDTPALLFVLACLMLPTATSYADTPPKRLVIAHAAAWTPYAFLGADGEPKGFVGAVGTTLPFSLPGAFWWSCAAAASTRRAKALK